MKQLLFVGGTTENNDSFVGPARMLTVDTERWELRLHDNETPGGHRILNLDQLKLIFMQLDSEFGGVAFSPDARGFLARVGDKQYALRTFEAGTGIAITNPAGTAGNPSIGIDPNYIGGLSFTANSIAFGGATTGSASSFALTLPANWPDADGSVAVFSFHVAPNDSATLSVNGGDPIALLLSDGSDKISQVAKINTRVLIVRDTDKYYIIGMQRAAGVGITEIAGLEISEGVAALNVQDAIEAIVTRLAALEGVGSPTSGQFFTFGNFGQVPGSTNTLLHIPLADGEYRLVYGNAPGGSYRTGGREGDENSFSGQLQINGVNIDGYRTGSAGSSIYGIVHRVGTAVWFAPVIWPFIWAADVKVHYGTAFHVGNVLADATTLNLQYTVSVGGSPTYPTNVSWRYSDPGVVA